MRDWLESNRVGPQRRLRPLHCPTCRKPARESDLGRMFVETVVLDEDTEYQTRLVNAVTEQIHSARDSVRMINPTSGAIQVAKTISGVAQSRNALSTSQYANSEPVVKNVMEVSSTSFRRAGAFYSHVGDRNCQRSRMTLNTAFGPYLPGWQTRTRR